MFNSLLSTLRNTGYRYLAYLTLFFAPLLTSAQISSGGPIQVNTSAGDDITNVLYDIFNIVIQIAFVLVIFYLLYGVYLFATSGGDESKRERGKDAMLYGVIGLIVVGGFLGLVDLVSSFLTVSGGTVPTPSTIQ